MNFKQTLLSVAAASGLFLFGSKAANADQVTYTVKSGDTVSQIAKDHNTTVKSIEKLNNLKNVNLIFVDQKLIVEENGEAANTAVAQVAQPATTAVAQAPVQQPVQQAQAAPAQQASSAQTNYAATQTQTQTQNTYSAPVTTGSSSEEAAKAWIAGRESGGSYTATNGNYYGKYQLSRAYLNGDYSAANQERVANQYVQARYGSWSAAKAHWLSNGWY